MQFAMSTGGFRLQCIVYHTKATINVDCIADADVLCITNDDRENFVRNFTRQNIFSVENQ